MEVVFLVKEFIEVLLKEERFRGIKYWLKSFWEFKEKDINNDNRSEEDIEWFIVCIFLEFVLRILNIWF